MLEATLYNILLITDIGLLLPLKGSPRLQIMERPVLVDEEANAKEIKDEGVKALKRRRSQEPLPILWILSPPKGHRA